MQNERAAQSDRDDQNGESDKQQAPNAHGHSTIIGSTTPWRQARAG
jgi:hypothetical protein